jgi:2-polyprenyl-3-methyl-5-hydroxy-6-metoxy-1,4-benzoquinol methylase
VGTGQLLLPLAPAFQHAEAVDLSEKMVGVCRRKVQEQGLLHVDVRCEDFMTSAATNHYDLITIGEALHWFPVRQVLLKCRDWLTDHGKLAVFVYNICNKIEGADERQT